MPQQFHGYFLPVEGPRRSRRVRLLDAHEPEASFDIGRVERDGNGEAGYTPRCEDYVQKVGDHFDCTTRILKLA